MSNSTQALFSLFPNTDWCCLLLSSQISIQPAMACSLYIEAGLVDCVRCCQLFRDIIWTIKYVPMYGLNSVLYDFK